MAISLTKGGNVNLSKEAPGLTNITVGPVSYTHLTLPTILRV